MKQINTLKKSLSSFLLLIFTLLALSSNYTKAQTTLVTELTGNPINTTGWQRVRNNSLAGTINGNEYILTADNTGLTSAIYYDTAFNLNQCSKWRIEFDYRIFGSGTSTYGNGDGMAFWYLVNPPQNFTSGGGIGMPSNARGIMMVMDTFDNNTEGPQSEIQILYGQGYHEYNNPYISKFNTLDKGINVRSNQFRPVVITWDNGKISVSINGVEIVSSFEPTLQPGTGNLGLGYFGFSASTGAASDRHSIRNVKVFMDMVQVNTKNVTLKQCDTTGGGFANFDLTSKKDEIISNSSNYTIEYYHNLQDLSEGKNAITNPENYTNQTAFGETIYVKVKNGEDCYDIAEIELTVHSILLNTLPTQYFCDDDFDGKITTNLKSYQNLLNTDSSITYIYYQDEDLTNEIADADLENFEITSFPSSIWVIAKKDFDNLSCQSIPTEIKFDLTNLVAINQTVFQLFDQPICLEKGKTIDIDLTTKENLFTDETSVKYTYYTTRSFAIAGGTIFISNPTKHTVSESGSVFVRLEKVDFCPNIIELKYEIIDQLDVQSSVELPTKCDDDFDGFVNFNLDDSIPLFTNNSTGLTFSYFLSQTDAENQNNPQSTNVFIRIGETKSYYVHITNGSCTTISTLIIKASNGLADVLPTIDPITICDEDFDGVYRFNLTNVEPLFVPTTNNYQFLYFKTETDARNLVNQLSQTEVNDFTINLNTKIWTVITDGSCSELRSFELEIGKTIPTNTTLPKIEECEGETTSLTLYESQITTEPNVNFTYFLNELDAQNNRNSISSQFNPINISGSIFIRLEKAGFCTDIIQLEYEFYPKPISPITTIPYLCENGTITLDAGNEFPIAHYVWTWSGGTLTNSEIIISRAGIYTLQITSNFGCVETFEYEVLPAPKPIIENIILGINYLIVEASTTEGTLEYSLDGITWQNDPKFDNLQNGKEYTVFVRNGFCDPVSKQAKIYYITNFISPNNDGYNDIWDVSFISDLKSMHIFDRYGRTIYFSDKKPFIWNGKINGASAETGNYWYVLESNNETKIEGSILLKNK